MSTLKVTNIQDTGGGNSSTSAEIYSGRAKAWLNIDGSPTATARASFNVNSFTDNGTGDFTINFSSSLTDANYAVVCTGSRNNGNSLDPLSWTAVHNLSSSGFDMTVTQTNSAFTSIATLSDLAVVIGVAVFR